MKGPFYTLLFLFANCIFACAQDTITYSDKNFTYLLLVHPTDYNCKSENCQEVGSIVFINKKTKTKSVEIEIGSNTMSGKKNKRDFIIADMNFDGYNDIALTSNAEVPDFINGTTKPYYFWLYNPQTGSFDADTVLSNLAGLEFFSKEKKVRQFSRRNDTLFVITWNYEKGKLSSEMTQAFEAGQLIQLGDLNLVIKEGISCDCSGDCNAFVSKDGLHYEYSESGFTPREKVVFHALPGMAYDSISANKYYQLAYGSRMSETEGVVFCLPKSKTYPKNSWFSYTDKMKIKKTRKNEFVSYKETNYEAELKVLPEMTLEQAKAWFRKEMPGFIDGAEANGNKEYRTELLKRRRVRLYIYSIHFEFNIWYKGACKTKVMSVRLLHGEC